MKFLYWRGNSLWCRIPECHALGIVRCKNTPAETKRCEREGEIVLAKIRTEIVEGTFFEKQKPVEEHYRPKFWRLVGNYWYHHLRFKKTGGNDRYHLMHSLKKFGSKYADEIYRKDVELWMNEMRLTGAAVNTINNRFAYLQAVYKMATSEDDPKKQFNYDPTARVKKLKGAKTRTFVLTEEKFERNHTLLRDGMKWRGEKPDKHCGEYWVTPEPRFALFYLALWETGRRPLEVSQYTWDMISEVNIDGDTIRCFNVPPEITKTDDIGQVVISDRLWREINMQAWRTGHIFLNSEGNPWKNWDRHKRKLERVYGKDGGWIRDCRRGFITHKCEVEGKDPAHVQMQSGHKTQSVFSRYRIGNLRNQAGVVKSTNEAQITKKPEKVAKFS